MNFHVFTSRHFKVEHCFDCAVPGYLIVSPVVSVISLAELQNEAQKELGVILAFASKAIQNTVTPLRIYCVHFGEEMSELHFHMFPRTNEITNEFLRAHPEQQSLIHGPLLLDWARARYRTSPEHVWNLAMPVMSALKNEFDYA